MVSVRKEEGDDPPKKARGRKKGKREGRTAARMEGLIESAMTKTTELKSWLLELLG
jgi:hypothetical protein